MKRTNISVFIPHIGCPHRCSFCDQRSISGAAHAPTPEEVAALLEEQAPHLAERGMQAEIAFFGGSFTAVPREYMVSLLECAHAAVQKHPEVYCGIRCSTRPDCVDDEIIAILKKYGMTAVELGAQSMCDEVLSLSGRGHTAADVEAASKMIKAAGFRLILQMMTGLPGDTKERSIETAKKIIALAPDGVRVYPTVIVRDTALFDLWQAGRYKEHSVDEAVDWCAALVPLFDAAGIPIIRLGLNPTEELSGGAAVGGAYHPALGELVKSRLMLYRAREVLAGVQPGAAVVLGTEAGRISQLVGQHRCNVAALTVEFGLRALKVRPCAAKNGDIRVLSVENG